jgi:hypothetical protein
MSRWADAFRLSPTPDTVNTVNSVAGEETGNAAGKADAAAPHSVYRVISVTPPENDNPAPPPAANDAKPATVAELLALSEAHRPCDGAWCRTCGA